MKNMTKDNVLKKIDELNAQNVTTTSSSEDDSVSTKLGKIGDEISSIQKTIDSLYKNVLTTKKHVSLCLLTSYVGRYYYYKALKTYNTLSNMLTLLKTYSDSNGISSLLSQLRELINLYFTTADTNEKNTIKLSIDKILSIIGSYNISDNSTEYSVNDSGDITVTYSYDKFIEYTPDNHNNAFRILYGTIGDNSLIAQTTPISIVINKNYDINTNRKINVTAANYNIINKEFVVTGYSPIAIIPTWRQTRYESVPYEVENEDATNNNDTTINVISALYFNGGVFNSNVIPTYSGMADTTKSTVKFLKQSNKWNFLTGSLTTSKEYTINSITTELNYDNPTQDDIASRTENNIADSINISIVLSEFTLSGELEYSAVDSTTRIYEYFSETETDKYNNAKKITESANVTCFSGSLTRSITSSSTNITETAIASSIINVKCYISKTNGKYRVEIIPNSDDTTVSSLYSSTDIDDVSLIAAVSQMYYAKATKDTTNLTATDMVNSGLSELSKLNFNLGQSELLNRIYTLEKSITNGIDLIKTKATEEISEISNYLYSYTIFSDCCKSEITMFDDTYVSNICDAMTNAYGNISAISSFDVNDVTTYNSALSTLSEQINSLLDSINTNLDGAITSYNTIEEIRNSVGAIASQYIDSNNYANLITLAKTIMSGESDTISALALGGFTFKTCSTTYSFTAFNTCVNDYLNGSNYYTTILYLLKENYHLIAKIDNSDSRLTTIQTQYYKIIKKLFISNMFNQVVVNLAKYKELIDIYSEMNKYKLQICDNVNNYFINSNILIYSNKLSKFNDIDIEELFNELDYDLSNLSTVVAPYKAIIYNALTSIDISEYANFFGNIIENEYKFGRADNLSLRDLFVIEAFRQVETEVVNTLQNYDYTDIGVTETPSVVQDLSTLQIYDLANNVFDEFKQKIIDYKKYYNINSNSVLSYFNIDSNDTKINDFITALKLKAGD